MALILAILKWIGIVLLAVIGLLLFVCAMVFFVPVRYVVECKTEDSFRIGFFASWLFGIVKFGKKMPESKVRLYLFGIKVKRLKRKHEKPPSKRQSAPVQKQKQCDRKETGKVESSAGEERKPVLDHVPADHDPSKKNFSFGWISSIITFIRETENRKGIGKIRIELIACIKYLKPRRVRGRIAFGTGDPCTTGWVLGVISMFPVAYTEGLHIYPNFEEKEFDADAYAKGRIRMLYFLRLFLRGYMDNDIMSMIKKAMQN